MMGTTYSRALPALPYGKNGRLSDDRITMKGKVATPHRRTIVDTFLGSLHGIRTDYGTGSRPKGKKSHTGYSGNMCGQDLDQSIPLSKKRNQVCQKH